MEKLTHSTHYVNFFCASTASILMRIVYAASRRLYLQKAGNTSIKYVLYLCPVSSSSPVTMLSFVILDSFFFVGKGPEPRRSDGIKVPVRGKDSTDQISSLKDLYTGEKDLILELPPTHNVYKIDWISLYCYRFAVNFAHVRIQNISDRIPPYVPAPRHVPTPPERKREPWSIVTLLGKVPRTTFTFQLGPPGGARAYESLAKAKPGEFVWYVNGYMTPELWVQRGVTYTMRVEGGDDAILERLFNPLYISDDPYGGYAKLADEDKSQITVYAGLNKQSQPYDGTEAHGERSYGRLCRFINNKSTKDPDSMDSFQEFKQNLVLRCLRGNAGVFQWTPDERTPDVVYYQSYTNFNMGWKIVVTDEIPTDLPFTEEEPYSYELLDSVEEGMYKKTGGNKQDADGSSANVIHNSWLACFTLVLAIFLSNVRAY